MLTMFDEFFCSDDDNTARDESDCFMPRKVFISAPVAELEKNQLEQEQVAEQVQQQCDTAEKQEGGQELRGGSEASVEDVLLQPCGGDDDDESLTDNMWAKDGDFETILPDDEGGDQLLQWTESDEFLFRSFGPAASSIQDASHTANNQIQATVVARPAVSTPTDGSKGKRRVLGSAVAKKKKKGRHTRCRMCGHSYAKGEDMHVYHLGLPFNGKAHTVCKTPEALRAPRFPWLKGRMPNKLSSRTTTAAATVHTTFTPEALTAPWLKGRMPNELPSRTTSSVHTTTVTPETLRAPRFPCFEAWMSNNEL